MWNKRYAIDSFLFGTAPAEALRKHASVFPERSSCLCVADGEGRNSVWLTEQGHSVTAWDGSEVAVTKAEALAKTRGVSVNFSVQDAETFDWSTRQFDVVVGVFIQFAGPQLRNVIFEGMKRATRPGGLLFLHGYTPKQIEYGTGGPPIAENLYTVELLENAFGDWDIQRLESYEADIQEGTGHSGHSALVDLIAWKPA